MAEYIEREALIAEIDDRIATIGFTSPYQDDITIMLEGMARVRDSVEDFPAADVVERKRGEWFWDEDRCEWCCGECSNALVDGLPFDDPDYEPDMNFCPNCGADMRSHQNILCDQGERRGE